MVALMKLNHYRDTYSICFIYFCCELHFLALFCGMKKRTPISNSILQPPPTIHRIPIWRLCVCSEDFTISPNFNFWRYTGADGVKSLSPLNTCQLSDKAARNVTMSAVSTNAQIAGCCAKNVERRYLNIDPIVPVSRLSKWKFRMQHCNTTEPDPAATFNIKV